MPYASIVFLLNPIPGKILAPYLREPFGALTGLFRVLFRRVKQAVSYECTEDAYVTAEGPPKWRNAV